MLLHTKYPNMKNKLYLLIVLMLAASVSQGQNIVLEFNANHTCTQVNLDSIRIENLTQDAKMVLYYPDNTAVLVITNIGDPDPEHLFVSQNYPNPFSALTYIDVYLAMPDMVSLNVYDLTGRTIARREDKLEEGMHRFSFSAGAETTYILNVTSSKQVERRIMLQMGTAGAAISELSYMGASADNVTKAAPGSSGFNFSPGDNLRITGYVTDIAGNVDYGVVEDTPEASTEYLFDIANSPPDQPSEISGEIDVPEYATGLVYEVNETTGLTYLWSVPEGWGITHGQGSHAIAVNAGSEGGEISVKAENNCGISEASLLFVDVYEVSELTTVTDIDGNVYKTVIIGDLEWMAENLRVTRYNNGDSIPTGLSNAIWQNTNEGAYAIYPYDDVDGINSIDEMVAAYGKLYNWYAVVDPRGICPVGWHAPSDDEWAGLINYVEDQGYPNNYINTNGSANALKSCLQVDSPLGGDCDIFDHPRWNSDEIHYGFDEFGFSALPGGFRASMGDFISIGGQGRWWTSTSSLASNAWRYIVNSEHGFVNRIIHSPKSNGLSLRCVQDAPHIIRYNLNLDVNPGGVGTVEGIGNYQEGELVNINAVGLPGWRFVEWSGDTEYLDDPLLLSAKVTMPPYDINLTANFEERDIIYGDGVIDIDGNEYVTVVIGHQEWMAENLRVTRYNNGDSIPTGLSNAEWINTNDGAFAIYPYANVEGINSEEEMTDAYGKLYNWHAVGDQRGLCPTGWHVPGNSELDQLINYLAVQGFPNTHGVIASGNALKSCRQINSPVGEDCNTSEHPRWKSHDIHYGFDEFGFSAAPSGDRTLTGSYGFIGQYTSFWSSAEHSINALFAYFWDITLTSGGISGGTRRKNFGSSIRCVRDTYSLILAALPPGAGTIHGAGKYLEGSQINILATAHPATTFTEWTGDTDYLDNPSSPNAIVTVPGYDLNLVANFEVADDFGEIIYGDGVTDVDGNYYNTVIIGNQEWMAENLRVTKYNNGDSIPTGLSSMDWVNTTEGAYLIFDHEATNTDGINSPEEMVAAYGKLYNWHAIVDSRDLCPTGWHVPTDDEWSELVNYVVDQGYQNESLSPIGAANALKSCRQAGSPFGSNCDISEHPRWNSDNTHHGFDLYGFSALPAGGRWEFGGYNYLGTSAIWWTSSEFSFTRAWYRTIGHSQSDVFRNETTKQRGFGVRCVRDNN